MNIMGVVVLIEMSEPYFEQVAHLLDKDQFLVLESYEKKVEEVPEYIHLTTEINAKSKELRELYKKREELKHPK
jgi:hypothetical protein